MAKTWFTADLHLGHKNVLLHCPDRIEAFGLEKELDDDVVAWHDEQIIEMWNSMVDKHDEVYILGDFIFSNKERAKEIINRLKGKKHLIIGNHDGSTQKLTNVTAYSVDYGEYYKEFFFETISHIKCKTFKKTNHPFLKENLHVVMCHYPIEVWPSKHYGWVHLHGHLHGRYDDINDAKKELRVDVGLDSRLAGFRLVSLEDIYNHLLKITGDVPFEEYVRNMRHEEGVVM